MKISEKKALEAYPIKIDRIYYGLPLPEGVEPYTNDINIPERNAYIKGYDQALQDFLEKAMEYFKGKPIHHFWVEDFKNYMEEEL